MVINREKFSEDILMQKKKSRKRKYRYDYLDCTGYIRRYKQPRGQGYYARTKKVKC